MNRTWLTLIVKFAVTFFVAWVTLGFIAGNPIGPIFAAALAGTLINYWVGDLMILPGLGNLIASASDGIIGAFAAYITGLFFPGFAASFFVYFLYALFIVVTEFIFHIYLMKSEKAKS